MKPDFTKGDDLLEAITPAVTPSSALQNIIANGQTPSESVASSVNGDIKEAAPEVEAEPETEPKEDVKEGTMHIEVQQIVEEQGDTQKTSTNVTVDVPHNHPALPEPEDPTAMIEEAKRMVAEAQKLEGEQVGDVSKKLKRRVEDILDEDELADERSSKLAKVAYTKEQKMTTEKVTRRALVGLGVMAAIG
jgi:hypothetical protein